MSNSNQVRTAHIGVYLLTSIAQAGIAQFGDRCETYAKLRAIAVQRQEEHWKAGDFYFDSYSIFNRPLPKLKDPQYENGKGVLIRRINCSPQINVGSVRIIAAGSSASLLAGNSMRYTGESRIKHIRQYKISKPYPPIGIPLTTATEEPMPILDSSC